VRPSVALPQVQPACRRNAPTGLFDCGNWADSASWTVPDDAVSGVFAARLVREDGVSA
jgi:N,N-dimethylformamidase beta subunit-like protein